MNNSLI